MSYLELKSWVGGAWKALRQATGDDAYERYLKHHAMEHGDKPALSRSAYYDEYQKQKWGGINRCC